jgi:hypothetical protein
MKYGALTCTPVTSTQGIDGGLTMRSTWIKTSLLYPSMDCLHLAQLSVYSLTWIEAPLTFLRMAKILDLLLWHHTLKREACSRLFILRFSASFRFSILQFTLGSKISLLNRLLRSIQLLKQSLTFQN